MYLYTILTILPLCLTSTTVTSETVPRAFDPVHRYPPRSDIAADLTVSVFPLIACRPIGKGTFLSLLQVTTGVGYPIMLHVNVRVCPTLLVIWSGGTFWNLGGTANGTSSSRQDAVLVCTRCETYVCITRKCNTNRKCITNRKCNTSQS